MVLIVLFAAFESRVSSPNEEDGLMEAAHAQEVERRVFAQKDETNLGRWILYVSPKIGGIFLFREA